MPELPEVEVVKKSLENNITNLVFKKIMINTSKLRYIINKNDFRGIINKKIISIKRRSKYLLISTEGGLTILAHLGMTGKFFIVKKNNMKIKTSFYYNLESKDDKHNHIIFNLTNNIILIYNDVRKFGFIKILSSSSIENNIHLKTLGPEPLSKKFNSKYFKDYSKNKRKKIKSVLMDQKFVAGLGNIYVNEILYLSHIKPNRSINKINNLEIKKIIKNTKKILVKSIKKGGSSIKDFIDSAGKEGSFQQNFYVYAREGKKCLKIDCKTKIKKYFIANRSTFFCKSCQK
jgi:formamidopyrimidine-DNA glycosylase